MKALTRAERYNADGSPNAGMEREGMHECDEMDEMERIENDRLIRDREVEESDNMGVEFACPSCGEQRASCLSWNDDNAFACMTCGCEYDVIASFRLLQNPDEKE